VEQDLIVHETETPYINVLSHMLRKLPSNYIYGKTDVIDMLTDNHDECYIVKAPTITYIILPQELIEHMPVDSVLVDDVSRMPTRATVNYDPVKDVEDMKATAKMLEMYADAPELANELREQVKLMGTDKIQYEIIKLYPKEKKKEKPVEVTQDIKEESNGKSI